ncbi:MAG: TIGR01212 family radical SAM protein [bacterium]
MYPWGHKRRFNSYTEYIRKTFGGRVQKVVVDAGFTCPNRDGAKGTGGCTYCSNDAFSPSYCRPDEPLHTQISKGIEFHAFRYRRVSRFLVYFQPYSNTYAPLSRLIKLYDEALSYPGVVGLVIGTRPDCMDEEKLMYLATLAKRHYIQVEYGVESCYNNTLRHINRGHDFEVSRELIEKTHEKGIRTGAHFIFGLPGESLDEMLHEADIISRMPVDTVKFHQLQIIRGTIMEKEYLEDPSRFHQFGLEDYIDFIIRFLERLSPSIVVERFAGEVPPPLLHHLSWDLIRYDEVLRRIEEELERRNTFQGKRLAIRD